MPKIKISQELYEKFAGRAREKGFASADAYIENTLNLIAEKLSQPGTTAPRSSTSLGATPSGSRMGRPSNYTPEQEKTVKDRLRDLGYID